MMSKPISKKLLGLISVAMLAGVITGDAFAQQNSQTGPPAKSGSDFDRHSVCNAVAILEDCVRMVNSARITSTQPHFSPLRGS
jgi:hypothetical protein